MPADYPEIERIAQKYGLKILEDGAQGFGGKIGQRYACSFGDAATTSFFPAKPLGCYGDGGAIFTNCDDLDETLRSIRAQGRSPHDKYDNRSVGLNSRLDTLQAAILIPKFKAFRDFEVDAVNQVAAWYTEALGDVVRIPAVPHHYRSSWAQYTILLDSPEQRDRLQQYLKNNNIPSMVYYPRGMHQQSATIAYGCQSGDFNATERVTKTCLSLPMHPYLTHEDVIQVSNAIIHFLRSNV
jgi:dTDP-4-amino-4,6-dideoxygalactose transaminase